MSDSANTLRGKCEGSDARSGRVAGASSSSWRPQRSFSDVASGGASVSRRRVTASVRHESAGAVLRVQRACSTRAAPGRGDPRRPWTRHGGARLEEARATATIAEGMPNAAGHALAWLAQHRLGIKAARGGVASIACGSPAFRPVFSNSRAGIGVRCPGPDTGNNADGGGSTRASTVPRPPRAVV